FMLGENVKARPDTVKRVLKEGHAIGNHSYNHVYKEIYSSFDAFWNQIEQTDNILRKVTGTGTNLLRAPGGTYTNFDAFYYYLLDAAGYKVLDWNVDSRDASRRAVPASEIVSSVTNTPLKDQMVVLMHDGSGHEQTVKALPRIIEHFKANGYTFAILEESSPVVQFPVGKVKWKRALSYLDFVRLLDKAEQRLGKNVPTKIANTTAKTPAEPVEKTPTDKTPAESPKVVQEKIAPVNNGTATGETKTVVKGEQKPSAPKTLKVIINGKPWELHDEQYSLVSGRFIVPIEGLAAQLDAVVRLDNAKHSIEICMGLSRVNLDYFNHTIQIITPGKAEETRPLVRMLAQPDGIHISLRTAVELLGGRITQYSVSGSSGVVEIECLPKTIVYAFDVG
ncbi:MAG: polysaccharide deacetylase family protein, partial [Gorillibacterium sp.]|nr:polysaccharide deacetylase family protein [Gorillibacterium sp.]